MAQIGDLKFYYSGGAANEVPALSLGGAKSTAPNNTVLSQSAVAVVSDISGVVVNDAFGNDEGNGELKWDNGTDTLSWKSPTGATFNGVVVTADGDLTLGDASGYVHVTVTWASLSVAGSITQSYTVTHLDAKVFDDVTAGQSLSGLTEYRCIYLENTSALTVTDVRIWVGGQPIGADSLELAIEAVDAVAIGPLADEIDSTDLLAGLTFTVPSTYAGALIVGTMTAGQVVPLWQKRIVPLNNNVQTIVDTSYISVSADV